MKRLTDEESKAIIDILKVDNTNTFKEIADKFNTDRKTVANIYNRVSKRHLTNEIEFAPRKVTSKPWDKEKVLEIVNLFLTTNKTNSGIARMYNADPKTIYRIRNRVRHANLIDPSLDLYKNLKTNNGRIKYKKLDKETIEAICKDLEESDELNFTRIATKYGVDRKIVANIYNGKTHTDVSSKYSFKKKKEINYDELIGKKYNNLTLVKHMKGKGGRLGVFKCDCGNEITKRIADVVNGKVKSCGCLKQTLEDRFKEDPDFDKDEYHRIIDIWRQMLKRCYQSGNLEKDHPKVYAVKELRWLDKDIPHPRYKDYGDRGIYVTNKWLYNRDEFYRWYRKHVSSGESIDRIYNDGPYSPSNCRGLNYSGQSRNQRTRKDNSTGYKGVGFTNYSYSYQVKHNNNQWKKEGFKSKHIALIERNIYIIKNGLPHDIQSIVDNGLYKTVQYMYSPYSKGYHIAYIEHGVPTIIHNSVTVFPSKDDVLLTKVIKKMNAFKGSINEEILKI